MQSAQKCVTNCAKKGARKSLPFLMLRAGSRRGVMFRATDDSYDEKEPPREIHRRDMGENLRKLSCLSFSCCCTDIPASVFLKTSILAGGRRDLSSHVIIKYVCVRGVKRVFKRSTTHTQ